MEDDVIYEALDRLFLEEWDSGKTITRTEWEEEYESFLDSDLESEIEESFCVEDDAFEQARLPYWDVRDLLEVSTDEWFGYLEELMAKELYRLRRALTCVRTRAIFLPRIADAALSGNWVEFTGLVHGSPDTIHDAFRHFYAAMPTEYRRDFVVGCYSSHGDSDWMCRLALRNLPKNGVSELPEEYRDADEITVYRAGEEPIEKASERISWSLEERTARFFLDVYALKHANYLYRAHIKPTDVIGYDNSRKEFEVLQYRSVYDVELIDTAGSGGTERFLGTDKILEKLKSQRSETTG